MHLLISSAFFPDTLRPVLRQRHFSSSTFMDSNSETHFALMLAQRLNLSPKAVPVPVPVLGLVRADGGGGGGETAVLNELPSLTCPCLSSFVVA
ncbi:hypothetical protein TrLO_g12358 [Triparma laevis f. longispina]|uniref:Uncharacterized protein n=1 Tax=Triparma laevis f. longispina TaxID=1714387 RepID=A0A9W7FUY4_9STRA|nr:hypothetical protein TrLO_g12358 [Triparma laevis f. longispina]